MKILFIEAYPGFRGAQRSLAALLEGIRRRQLDATANSPKIEAAVLCLAPGRAEEGYRQSGADVHLLTPPAALQVFGGGLRGDGPPQAGRAQKLRAVTALARFTPRLRHFLRQHRPDVVHCNQARGVLLAGPAARSLGLPLVWHQRGMLDLSSTVTAAAGLLAQHLICVSRAVRQSLPKRLRRRSTVINNGIDRPSSNPSKTALRSVLGIDTQLASRGLPQDAIVLITTSSFLPYKGLHHVVDALACLTERRPESLRRLFWVVLGDDDEHPVKEAYRRQLLASSRKHSLNAHIWWAGWQEKATDWIAAADLCLLPTIARETWVDADGHPTDVMCSEGFPRTVLEAMAVGTPILATDVAAVKEQIVDGESGVILPPGDPQALATAIDALVGDGARRRSLATAGHQRVQRFSIEAMTEQTVSFLTHRVLA